MSNPARFDFGEWLMSSGATAGLFLPFARSRTGSSLLAPGLVHPGERRVRPHDQT